jgi:KDO2-lipid IV(A) lauroyltransferase
VQALEASAADAEEWGRRASEIRACDDLDMHYLPRMKGKTRRLLEIEGLDNLERALAGGRGAILFSGHIRRSQLFFAALSELGHPSTIVGFRRRRDDVIAREFGCRCIWMRAGNFGAAVKAANVLRHNGVVVMLIDQPHEGTTVEARFLGRRMQFTFGPALVAQTTGAPMLDFYVHREDRWVPQIGVIGAPFWADGSLEEAVQLCVSRFERRVRHYPAQWQGTVARS